MEEETIRQHNYEEFLSGYSLPSSDDLDLMEREENEVPSEVMRDNRRLWFAGLLSLISAGGIFAISNYQIFTEAWPFFLGAGIVGAGLGVMRLLGKVFRRKTLSLPKLELRRKTEKTTQNAMNTFASGERSNRLTKSDTDKVFMGVAGGIAAQSGIPSSLIRAAWIVAFAMTSGVAAFVYLALGLFMPSAPKQLPQK
jgi:phage shock protein PspC (stress-responsive transcriptional regulator)